MIDARGEEDLVVRMVDGEDLLAGLEKLSLDSAIVVCGIGMLERIEIGYWNGAEYETHRIESPAELVSLQGTIARCEGRSVVHVHACVATRDGSTVGGHLLAGTVRNTAELGLRRPRGIVLERREEASGLTGLYPRLRQADEDAG